LLGLTSQRLLLLAAVLELGLLLVRLAVLVVLVVAVQVLLVRQVLAQRHPCKVSTAAHHLTIRKVLAAAVQAHWVLTQPQVARLVLLAVQVCHHLLQVLRLVVAVAAVLRQTRQQVQVRQVRRQ
jgi:hypothetical protein